MHSLKPIETRYKGYRFRSRLEARWAVFFDGLGLRWKYEAEGFDLAGTWYLPDFWIEDWSAWLEIKPGEPSEDERKRCQLLALLGTSRVLMVCGDPWPDEYKVLEFMSEEPLTEKPMTWVYDQFAQCRRCDLGWQLCSDHSFADLGRHWQRCVDSDRWPVRDTSKLLAAYAAAREARF